MWSSCPCVIRMPLSLSWLRLTYVKSGITQSTPGMFSSGKLMPQSTIIMSPPYSIAVMFLPISPMPPKGIIFTGLGFLYLGLLYPCLFELLLIIVPL